MAVTTKPKPAGQGRGNGQFEIDRSRDFDDSIFDRRGKGSKYIQLRDLEVGERLGPIHPGTGRDGKPQELQTVRNAVQAAAKKLGVPIKLGILDGAVWAKRVEEEKTAKK
jgi:hypothetical protein